MGAIVGSDRLALWLTLRVDDTHRLALRLGVSVGLLDKHCETETQPVALPLLDTH